MPLVGGFSRGAPFPPPPRPFIPALLHTGITTIIGSQDLAQRRNARVRGNRRSPREPADQLHRPARFALAKKTGVNRPGIEPDLPLWETSSLNAQPPRMRTPIPAGAIAWGIVHGEVRQYNKGGGGLKWVGWRAFDLAAVLRGHEGSVPRLVSRAAPGLLFFSLWTVGHVKDGRSSERPPAICHEASSATLGCCRFELRPGLALSGPALAPLPPSRGAGWCRDGTTCSDKQRGGTNRRSLLLEEPCLQSPGNNFGKSLNTDAKLAERKWNTHPSERQSAMLQLLRLAQSSQAVCTGRTQFEEFHEPCAWGKKFEEMVDVRVVVRGLADGAWLKGEGPGSTCLAGSCAREGVDSGGVGWRPWGRELEKKGGRGSAYRVDWSASSLTHSSVDRPRRQTPGGALQCGYRLGAWLSTAWYTRTRTPITNQHTTRLSSARTPFAAGDHPPTSETRTQRRDKRRRAGRVAHLAVEDFERGTYREGVDGVTLSFGGSGGGKSRHDGAPSCELVNGWAGFGILRPQRGSLQALGQLAPAAAAATATAAAAGRRGHAVGPAAQGSRVRVRLRDQRRLPPALPQNQEEPNAKMLPHCNALPVMVLRPPLATMLLLFVPTPVYTTTLLEWFANKVIKTVLTYCNGTVMCGALAIDRDRRGIRSRAVVAGRSNLLILSRDHNGHAFTCPTQRRATDRSTPPASSSAILPARACARCAVLPTLSPRNSRRRRPFQPGGKLDISVTSRTDVSARRLRTLKFIASFATSHYFRHDSLVIAREVVLEEGGATMLMRAWHVLPTVSPPRVSEQPHRPNIVIARRRRPCLTHGGGDTRRWHAITSLNLHCCPSPNCGTLNSDSVEADAAFRNGRGAWQVGFRPGSEADTTRLHNLIADRGSRIDGPSFGFISVAAVYLRIAKLHDPSANMMSFLRGSTVRPRTVRQLF
ncbi:hypothetical protein PR048_021845 [Dryococelus australis]|uniref:Uncharacterized protein n=1 Tax=Dryococelus australis TaxID=614101 RepID=A0ABQ9GZE7_9NEOP|nr:hypothetical protein PR048_021845 [Dryococelus australis]